MRLTNGATLQGWSSGFTFYQLLALPLLPAGDIEAAFRWLLTNTPPDILEFFQSIINYVENQWLRRVRPENFSVFGLQNRTNNPMEAYHRVLSVRWGEHPRIWKFTSTYVYHCSIIVLL